VNREPVRQNKISPSADFEVRLLDPNGVELQAQRAKAKPIAALRSRT
jgi:hypothetical protein